MDVPRNMGSKMENVTLLKADMVAGSRCPCCTHPAPIREATPSSPIDLAAAEKAPLVEAEARPLMPFASEDAMAVKFLWPAGKLRHVALGSRHRRGASTGMAVQTRHGSLVCPKWTALTKMRPSMPKYASTTLIFTLLRLLLFLLTLFPCFASRLMPSHFAFY